MNKLNKPLVYLTRRETFSASHRLHNPNFSDEKNKLLYGKCNWENGHGHNYILEVTICEKLDEESSMLLNISELKNIIKEHVIDKVDHRHLNHDVPEFMENNPTAEVIVVMFWHWLKKAIPDNMLYEVRLQETENNWSVYRGE